jgi:hypothetical protein
MAELDRREPPSAGNGKRLRSPARSIVTAAILAVAALVLGVIGFQRVTAQPTQSITFDVADGLPYGITQESVEASALEYDATSYEPFTMRVVERELTWDETSHGRTGDADVLLSVGSSSEEDEDVEDLAAEEELEGEEYRDDSGADTVLADFNRVAFKGEGSSNDGITESSAVREAFVNNQTLGHGPGAVVGAALTAADVKFNSGNRSPAFWGSLAALPMFLALLVTYSWMRDRKAERRRARELSAAQSRLARVVLELDSLQLRFELAKQAITDAAGADKPDESSFATWRRKRRRGGRPADEGLAAMEQEWADIRSTSLRLARQEERLQALFRDRGKPAVGDTMEDALKDLEAFDEDTEALQRKAAALADAAEVRMGHAGTRSVLDQLAFPLIQAVDDVLYRKDLLPEHGEPLVRVRAELLALSSQAASADTPETAPGEQEEARSLSGNHAELLKQWGAAEERLRTISVNLEDHLRGELRARGKSTEADRSVEDQAERRAEQRILSMTTGKTSTFQELRRTLGLGYGTRTGPLQAVESVLVLLDSLQRGVGLGADDRASSEPGDGKQKSSGEKSAAVMGTAGLLIPVLVALGLGWMAVAQLPSPKSYGKVLTGDQELQGLNIYGDASVLPPAEENLVDDVTQAESLDLDFIRERMQRSADCSPDQALFPEELTLTVAIVPADDYIEYRRDRGASDSRMVIDYWDAVEGHRQLKEDVAKEHPEVLDPETGDITRGQGILPVWVLDEDTYAIGYTLTGQISSGVDSRVGRYAFRATEPSRKGPHEDNNLLIGFSVAYDLSNLAEAMEYNHMESSNVDAKSVFWMTAISAWTGIMTLGVLGIAVRGALQARKGTQQVRSRLGGLRTELNNLAMGLDMTRLDLVAVLGGERSTTGGDAEASEQRLYEAGLVTAWRELDALESLPRKLQRGEEWTLRVNQVQELVEMLATRSQDISTRSEQWLRSQRRVAGTV